MWNDAGEDNVRMVKAQKKTNVNLEIIKGVFLLIGGFAFLLLGSLAGMLIIKTNFFESDFFSMAMGILIIFGSICGGGGISCFGAGIIDELLKSQNTQKEQDK